MWVKNEISIYKFCQKFAFPECANKLEVKQHKTDLNINNKKMEAITAWGDTLLVEVLPRAMHSYSECPHIYLSPFLFPWASWHLPYPQTHIPIHILKLQLWDTQAWHSSSPHSCLSLPPLLKYLSCLKYEWKIAHLLIPPQGTRTMCCYNIWPQL